MSQESLSVFLTPAALRRMAGAAAFERGVLYRDEDRVSDIAVTDNQVAARVRGTETYRVRLWDSGAGLEFDCTCPQGVDLRFCKHCVAVALVWNPPEPGTLAAVAGRDDPWPVAARVASPPRPTAGSGERARVRALLEGLTQRELVSMVMEEADRNAALRRRLKLRIAVRVDTVDVSRLRKAVGAAFRARGDDYDGYGAPDADRVLAMVDELRALLDAAPDALIGLVEHAASLAERAVERLDDEDEDFPEVFDALGDLHYEACARARLDPAALAGRLFELEMSSDYVFYRTAARYADVLGAEGVAAYRALVRNEWDRIPALEPGERDEDRSSRRTYLAGLVESFAEADGDLEARVEVRRRDLSSAHDFQRIGELYREAGDSAKAIEWAQAGLAAFPQSPDARLRRFLADEYLRTGQHAEALELAWAEFTERPELEPYQRLIDFADAAGDRAGWRERALAFAQDHADGQRREHQRAGTGRPFSGYTQLVRMLLWDDDVDRAWAAAHQGGCGDEVWFQLARRREETHPADAIPVYQRRIERNVEQGSNRGYEDGVRLLSALQRLYARAGEDADTFAQYVTRLRTTYKRKRNFIKLLDAARLCQPVHVEQAMLRE